MKFSEGFLRVTLWILSNLFYYISDYYNSESGCSGCNLATLKLMVPHINEQDIIHMSTRNNFLETPFLGSKYFGFFSFRSLKTREKYISFAQLVLFSCSKNIIVNFIIQKLKSKHTSLKKYTNWAKLTDQN